MQAAPQHEQGHGHGHSHGDSHNQRHGHGAEQSHTPAPTQGRLIRKAWSYDLRVGLMLLGQTRKLRTLPLDLAGIRTGDRVLDVGCGTGDLAIAAARRAGQGATVVGIDASPEMVEVAREKARKARRAVRFQVEAVEALTFDNGSFDVVLSSLMMHHLPADLKLRALAEIRRVLRPGGRLVIIDLQATARSPRLWEPGWMVMKLHKGPAHHGAVERADGAALAELLRGAGFEAVDNGPTRYTWVGYARGKAPA
jgi:ubiquinone/menaquinone biosynthesis C-methylase UbiE